MCSKKHFVANCGYIVPVIEYAYVPHLEPYNRDANAIVKLGARGCVVSFAHVAYLGSARTSASPQLAATRQTGWQFGQK